jgi:hypothetical protein
MFQTTLRNKNSPQTFLHKKKTFTTSKSTVMVKFSAALFALVVGYSSAFAPVFTTSKASTSALYASGLLKDLPGALPPLGIWDPLGFSDKADEATLKRYREAEITHGRVAMLATVGFLVGEKVEGSSFLFDAQISGPAISHLSQVPTGFWIILTIAIGATEQYRATIGWVEPENIPIDQPGKLREEYTPGDIGFDPLGLKPTSPEAMLEMQNKELQNGRLASKCDYPHDGV